ncbi:MAG: hypothetical protein ABIG11_01770 [bacterium]
MFSAKSMDKPRGVIYAFLLVLLFPVVSPAQQLYISSAFVVYADQYKYCSPPPDAANGFYDLIQTSTNNVSFCQKEDCKDAGPDLNPWEYSALIEYDQTRDSYPGGCLALCATIGCAVSTSPFSFAVNKLEFQVFKFSTNANPMDPASTPPLRTIPLYNVGNCTFGATDPPGSKIVSFKCAGWDGSYNVEGEFGKTNGQFGFRAAVETEEPNPATGTMMKFQHTVAYPGQDQIPIQVDVTNVHVVRTTPTLVGSITPVAAQPYNIGYRLSKDATAYVDIYNPPNLTNPVRSVVAGLPRLGEGTPEGKLKNWDFWDGRNYRGGLMPAGVYLAKIDAKAEDEFGLDMAWGTTRQIGLDPLQITDIKVKSLGYRATDQAVISYTLTEAATVYLDIYPPGTVVSSVNESPPQGVMLDGVDYGSGDAIRIRRFVEQREARHEVSTIWDGRDSTRNPMSDGDYVYTLYAELPAADIDGNLITVRTSKTRLGAVPVAKGLVVVQNIQPSSAVIGSSPPVASVSPFYFRYTLSRDSPVYFRILDVTGQTTVKTLVNNEVRVANYQVTEIWNGLGDNGLYVSSGVYLAELAVRDAQWSNMVTTVTVAFSADLFRITNIVVTPLLGGTSDQAYMSYTLSQPMWVEWKIYPPGTVISGSLTDPELAVSTPPVYTVSGQRAGKYTVTEIWDGRDQDGLFIPDGNYVYTLVAKSTSVASGAIYATDRVYGDIAVTRGQILFNHFDVIPTVPILYNSSEPVKLPNYEISYSLTRQSSVTVQVLATNSPWPVLANVLMGGVREANLEYREFWDGKCNVPGVPGYGLDQFVPSGAYTVRWLARELGITSQLSTPTTVWTTLEIAPLRIYDIAISPLLPDQPAMVSYQVSEPMIVALKIYKQGTVFDLNGTPAPPENVSLVKKIVGMRAGRVQINEEWDGRDDKGSMVPDGRYVFKLYGSTDIAAVDKITGNFAGGTVMADDIITYDIPVVRGSAADACAEFESGSFFYPNPFRGAQGKFSTWYPVAGVIGLKLYNLAGDLVLEHDFGKQAGRTKSDPDWPWDRKNSSGRKVAHGVYFAVFRLEGREGFTNVCQTVKKILIP